MNWFSIIVVYIMLWWLVFFTILPIGVKSQSEHAEEGGEIVPGTPESAPIKPRMWIKLLATSLITAVLLGAFYVAIVNHWFAFLNVGIDQDL